jgi:opacity protein-like surface antigen
MGQDAYQFGIHSGPLLPSRIAKVREILPSWGLKFVIPTSKGTLEPDLLMSNAKGVTYYSGSLGARLNVGSDDLPVHFILGVHADYFKPPERDWRYAGGWYSGGGISQSLTESLLARADFRYRFGPGQSLYVGVGLMWVLNSNP